MSSFVFWASLVQAVVQAAVEDASNALLSSFASEDSCVRDVEVAGSNPVIPTFTESVAEA